jgi:hypothetical protein
MGGLTLLAFPVLLILFWMAPAPGAREWLAEALLSYEAAVLALLGGVHWAVATGPYGSSRIAAEWLTGFACLIIAWASLSLPVYLGLTLLIAAFLLLALRDVLIAEAAAHSSWFATMRLCVAAAAIVTAVLALVRILT